MNKYKLVICEDNDRLTPVLESYCIELKKKYPNLEYRFWDFETLMKIDNSFEGKADLILLDLLDETDTNELLGVRVLEIIKSREIKIPVIVYTTLKDPAGSPININALKTEYPFAVFIQKYDIGHSPLKDEIELKIKNKLNDQYEVDSDYIDEFKQQLHYFGEGKLNQLLFEIKAHYNIPIENKIRLFKLKSGFSGAILFKFKVDNTEYVLKVSNDVKLLEEEYAKAEKFYPLFPSKFFNRVETKKFYTGSKETIGAVIKLIPNSNTLFDCILKSEDKNEVESVLFEIFYNNGLKDHYNTQIQSNENWTNIFNKFKHGRFTTIKEVYKELKPLLNSVDIEKIQQLIEKDDFNQLNPIKLVHQGSRTLNHLDLHSKNILIQGKYIPFLIDTGVMDYGYWCFDLCRLLVDLLINGIDVNQKEFYDVNSIVKNLVIGKNLIKLEPIGYDSKNDRVIDAINWLTSKANDIYFSHFILWEFQLGLMKELLQMSYRTGSVPHSKRALALELSYLCMTEADKNAGIK